jgi:hypothetical protein
MVRWVAWSTLVVVALLLSVITHEVGHAIAAEIDGSFDVRLYMWPGIQVYPDFGGERFETWPGTTLALTHITPVLNLISAPSTELGRDISSSESELQEEHLPIIQLMGCGINLLISLICLTLLLTLKPQAQGWTFKILFLGSLFYYDLLTYTVFPYFFNAPHLLFVGGNDSEPLIALQSLGVAEPLAAGMIIVISSLLTVLAYFAWKKCQHDSYDHTHEPMLSVPHGLKY